MQVAASRGSLWPAHVSPFGRRAIATSRRWFSDADGLAAMVIGVLRAARVGHYFRR